MGVMRYVANKNRVWGQADWCGWVLIVVGVFMAILFVWAAMMLASSKTNGKKRSWVLLALASLSTGGFTVFVNSGIIRAYYFFIVIFVIIVAFQLAKCVGNRVFNHYYGDG
jgi:hypothetical protein